MTWSYALNKTATMLGETSALPSCTLCDDVSLCLGTIIGMNSVDFCIECFIMTPFGCRAMRTSRTVMCVSTEIRKKVTNHRGQSQNKQSGFERTCPTCGICWTGSGQFGSAVTADVSSAMLTISNPPSEWAKCKNHFIEHFAKSICLRKMESSSMSASEWS